MTLENPGAVAEQEQRLVKPKGQLSSVMPGHSLCQFYLLDAYSIHFIGFQRTLYNRTITLSYVFQNIFSVCLLSTAIFFSTSMFQIFMESNQLTFHLWF